MIKRFLFLIVFLVSSLAYSQYIENIVKPKLEKIKDKICADKDKIMSELNTGDMLSVKKYISETGGNPDLANHQILMKRLLKNLIKTCNKEVAKQVNGSDKDTEKARKSEENRKNQAKKDREKAAQDSTDNANNKAKAEAEAARLAELPARIQKLIDYLFFNDFDFDTSTIAMKSPEHEYDSLKIISDLENFDGINDLSVLLDTSFNCENISDIKSNFIMEYDYCKCFLIKTAFQSFNADLGPSALIEAIHTKLAEKFGANYITTNYWFTFANDGKNDDFFDNDKIKVILNRSLRVAETIAIGYPRTNYSSAIDALIERQRQKY